MANPEEHAVLGEEEARQAQERYAALEVKLQALRLHNEELTRGV